MLQLSNCGTLTFHIGFVTSCSSDGKIAKSNYRGFKVRSYKLNSSRGHTTDFYLGLPTVGQIQGVLPEIFGRGVRPTF